MTSFSTQTHCSNKQLHISVELIFYINRYKKKKTMIKTGTRATMKSEGKTGTIENA